MNDAPLTHQWTWFGGAYTRQWGCTRCGRRRAIKFERGRQAVCRPSEGRAPLPTYEELEARCVAAEAAMSDARAAGYERGCYIAYQRAISRQELGLPVELGAPRTLTLKNTGDVGLTMDIRRAARPVECVCEPVE